MTAKSQERIEYYIQLYRDEILEIKYYSNSKLISSLIQET